MEIENKKYFNTFCASIKEELEGVLVNIDQNDLKIIYNDMRDICSAVVCIDAMFPELKENDDIKRLKSFIELFLIMLALDSAPKKNELKNIIEVFISVFDNFLKDQIKMPKSFLGINQELQKY